MDNRVSLLIRKASAEGWCDASCQICHGLPFRRAARELPERFVIGFLESLPDLELTGLKGYEGYVELLRRPLTRTVESELRAEELYDHRFALEHPVADVIRTAVEERWCRHHMCSSCGNIRLRIAARELSSGDVDRFLDLSPPSDLTGLRGYCAILGILREKPLPERRLEPALALRPCADRTLLGQPCEYLIRQACAKNWCNSVGCTTCGCMMFRTIVRDLPWSLIQEYLNLPIPPEDERPRGYRTFRVLMVMYPLPRSREEERAASARRAAHYQESERLSAERRSRVLAEREARRATRAREGAERHQKRQEAGAWRGYLHAGLSEKPLQYRLEALVRYPELPLPFFLPDPRLLTQELVACLPSAYLSELRRRLAGMHSKRWRETRRRIESFANG